MRELGIIEDGAVLIADGKIVAVGTTDEIAKHELSVRASIDEIDCPAKSCCRALLTPTPIPSSSHRG